MTVIDDLVLAVQNIENELGLQPAGIYASIRTRLDIMETRINNPFAPAPNVQNPFLIGNSGVTISTGVGSPTENRLPGSLYLRTDGATDQGLYALRPDGYWHQIITNSLTNRTVHSVLTALQSPYTATLNDDFIPVDLSSGGTLTIILPASPTIGKTYTIADQIGNASGRPTTVSGNGKNINGSPTFVININFQSLNIVFNGLNWTKV